MTSILALGFLHAVAPTTISIHLDRPGVPISPSLYGIFFEEINQAGDGGLYGELLNNRGLEALPKDPKRIPGWRTGEGVTTVDQGPNEAHPRAFAIPTGGTVTNTGFGGLALEKGAKYRVTVWARGPGTVGVGFGEKPVRIGKAGEGWKRLERTVKAEGTGTNVQFVVTAIGGPVEVGYVSLMPEKLWKGRKNGMRPDLAERVAAMDPAFVRFPGGCYVEGGDRFADAFDWKRSLGPVDARKGLAHSMWGYPNTFGLGYHEYLQWCEDLGADPLFVVNAGIDHAQVTPMAEMGPWVQSALDAIEYANGSVTSEWGAKRAKAGHPAPFGVKYVEIGNENGGGFHGGDEAYIPRYRLIYDAIKAKYPAITTISNAPLPNQPVEVIDEHYYSDPGFFWRNMNRYDDYRRTGPKIYVGEYAVTQGSGMGNLAAALGEAAFMTGMERNADIVTMSSYAPLLVNVANRQWNPNAIVFDEGRSYGTPSYHVQALFANNRPDRNVVVDFPALSSPVSRTGGGLSLMTWATKAEFRDITVRDGDRTLYSSDGVGASGFGKARGEWSVTKGVLTQSSLDTDRSVAVKGATTPSGDYTIDLKARKFAGAEGFIIRFDERDGRWLQWNVGGWGNRETAFQDASGVVGDRLPMAVETNRWYDVRIERRGDTVRGYLDGTLVQTITEKPTPDFTAVAGVDEKARELVVKVVNGSDEERTAALDLGGARVGDVAKAIVLTGPSLLAENTFEAPNAIAPTTATVPWTGSYTFLPRSVTVLRLPIR